MISGHLEPFLPRGKLVLDRGAIHVAAIPERAGTGFMPCGLTERVPPV
jgi:hypothetical protein